MFISHVEVFDMTADSSKPNKLLRNVYTKRSTEHHHSKTENLLFQHQSNRDYH